MTGRQYSDGEYLYRAGDPADGVYRLRSGRVRIRTRGVTTAVGAGEFFGADGFLTGDGRDGDAIAEGPVSADFLRRNEFLAIVSLNPALTASLVSGVFDLVGPAARAPSPDGAVATANGTAAPSPDPRQDGKSAAPAGSIFMIPDGKRIRAIVGADEIAVDRLPFRIGRAASGEGKDTYFDIDLALEDKRPFNLSRRHFSIEEHNGGLIVRDCGSYHGTTLNGMILGGQNRPQTAPLLTGESELVAGKSDSPFRFRIVVE